MSSLVEFEDLALLDGHDLRTVLDQVPTERVVEAMAGSPTWLCRQLLGHLPLTRASFLSKEIGLHGPVPRDVAMTAQRMVVEALCHLGRGGIIAFDDPEDMTPESLVA